MLQYFWWGSVFLIAVPVMVLLLVLGPRLLPEYKDPKAGRLDLLSAGLSIVAVLAVIYGIKSLADGGDMLHSAGPIGSDWWSARSSWRQLRLAYPLLDLSLFARPSFFGGARHQRIRLLCHLRHLLRRGPVSAALVKLGLSRSSRGSGDCPRGSASSPAPC
ncbi:MAG: hypothetical protein NVV63_11675 [Opitutus sp.]|nr:hypothetical protein [Opitutus sp.]